MRASGNVAVLAAAVMFSLGITTGAAIADAGHSHGEEQDMLESMKKMHAGHDHGHDFSAIERTSPEEIRRTMELMSDLGLAVPPMDSHRGKELFLEKGCIVCHQVNGVGGEIGPSLNAADMPEPMNAFEFAARMWRGAPAMVQLQEQLLGDMIGLTGQELADIIAFVHDEAEQKELSAQDIPAEYESLIR